MGVLPVLIGTGDIGAQLRARLYAAHDRVIILSAYVRSEALAWIFGELPEGFKASVTVVARWSAEDLLSGASDLAAFDECSQRGFEFRRHSLLHAKCLLVDDEWLLVGSANFTRRGLGLAEKSNVELMLDGSPPKSARDMIQQVADESTPLTRKIVDMLRDELGGSATLEENQTSEAQEKAIRINRILREFTELRVGHFFLTTPSEFSTASEVAKRHDLGILGIQRTKGQPSSETVRANIMITPVWIWIWETLQSLPDRSASFGALTAMVHERLARGGSIRRKKVKVLLANTLDWIQFAAPNGIRVEQGDFTCTIRAETRPA